MANSAIDTSLSSFFTLKYWMRPTLGTPDYYNACNPFQVGVPQNEAGYQQAKGGQAYVGLFNYYGDGSGFANFREYLQVKLKEKLKKDAVYMLRFNVSPTGQFSVASISAFASSVPISSYTTRQNVFAIPQLTNKTTLSDSAAWYEISGLFTANGDEEWLIIGNFFSDGSSAQPYNLFTKNAAPGASCHGYLYLDDVSLVLTRQQNLRYLCSATDSVELSVESIYPKFIWHDGDTTSRTRYINQEGKYWVNCYMPDGAVITDSTEIRETPHIYERVVQDTFMCPNTVLILNIVHKGPSYLWSKGDTSSNCSFVAPGQYWLQSKENGCVRTDTFLIFAKTLPLVSKLRDTSFCRNASVSVGFDNLSPYSFLWQDGATTPNITVTQPGKINVLVRDSFCSIYDSANVVQRELPVLKLSGKLHICEDRQDSTVLGMPVYALNEWYPGPIYSVGLVVYKSGWYWHTATDAYACSNTDSFFVKDACEPAFFMPNAFTANHDGLNDSLKWTGKYIGAFNIKIVDRWGILVYESSDFNSAWDGTQQGLPLPCDTYFYTVTYTSMVDQTPATLNGKITLLR